MNLPKGLLLLALLLTGSTLTRAAELVGKWTADFDSQIGAQKYVYEFKAEGDKLSGTATFDHSMGKGTVALKEIKVSGDDVSFLEPMKFSDQEVVITYHGKLAGDEMRLTRVVGDFGTEQIVAKRVLAAAPAPAPAKP